MLDLNRESGKSRGPGRRRWRRSVDGEGASALFAATGFQHLDKAKEELFVHQEEAEQQARFRRPGSTRIGKTAKRSINRHNKTRWLHHSIQRTNAEKHIKTKLRVSSGLGQRHPENRQQWTRRFSKRTAAKGNQLFASKELYERPETRYTPDK